MKRAFIGNLWMARRIASRATGSLTPDNSKITRPGLTLATHHSGEPLPEPIRVSAGFLVSGRSGKTLIHTLPPRLMWRVMAIRAASICRFVTYAPDTAWIPSSPNLSVVPPVATPRRLGWCCLRTLTLRGTNNSTVPPHHWWPPGATHSSRPYFLPGPAPALDRPTAGPRPHRTIRGPDDDRVNGAAGRWALPHGEPLRLRVRRGCRRPRRGTPIL